MTNIIDANEIFVKEQVRTFKFGNVYDYFDTGKNKIAEAREENITGIRKLFKVTKYKPYLPFDFSIYTPGGEKIASLQRPFSPFLAKIKVSDANGKLIGRYQQKFHLLKPVLKLLDAQGQEFAEIRGNIIAWNFTITAPDGQEIGKVTKKWAGVGRELFTTADNYLVQLNKSGMSEDRKKMLTTVPGVIDMVFKEYKH